MNNWLKYTWLKVGLTILILTITAIGLFKIIGYANKSGLANISNQIQQKENELTSTAGKSSQDKLQQEILALKSQLDSLKQAQDRSIKQPITKKVNTTSTPNPE